MAQSEAGLLRSASVSSAFRRAMDSIRALKARSILPLLGVIISVARVLLVYAAIEGLGVYAGQSTIRAFGSVAQTISVSCLRLPILQIWDTVSSKLMGFY